MAEKVEFYKETEFKDTEIGRIPKEWKVVKLEEITTKIKDIDHKMPKKQKIGIPFVSIKCMLKYPDFNFYLDPNDPDLEFISKEEYEYHVQRFDVERGDIIYSRFGSIGNAKLVTTEQPFIASYSIVLIKPNRHKVNLTFLTYILNSETVRKQAKIATKGATNRNLHLKDIKNLRVPLLSLFEQQKIAEILSTVDESIQKTDELIAKTERLKKGLMQELLTKGIGHKEFKDTKIGKLPEEWEVRTLGEIGELSRGLSYRGQEKFAEEVSGSYLFLTLNSIKEGGGLKENGWSWIRTDRLGERHFVREGDIVIANTEQSKDGSLIGSPAIVHFPEWYKKDKAVYSHHISKLTLKVGSLDINFFYYYLCSTQPIARKYYTVTGVWGLKVDSWAKDLDVIIPPLSEQQQIASILLAIDERLDILRKERVKLERIKQWFMEELLSGKIRVRVA